MRIPGATYRFQFHKGFTFEQARGLLGYLQELGVTDVYASPIFLAGPESTHGYDICGFNQINPNPGTREEFEKLAADLRENGMGMLVDMVPNHMGIHATNCWWTDVLKKGAKSKYARYFDIQWDGPEPLLKGKVLLPVLGDRYGAVLGRGELRVEFEKGEFQVAYYDKRFPVSPEALAEYELEGKSEDERADFLREMNGTASEAKRFDRLHAFLELQHYRLAYWRVGAHEINYRRFFDVTELVSVRVEEEEVFQETHRLLLELVKKGAITGLRIDHPDGLRDPRTYFNRLNSEGKNYVLAEKILSGEERLAEDWAVHGTTGYDYLVCQNALFVRRENEKAFTEIYERWTGSREDFATIAFRSKREVLNRMFIAEVNGLTRRLKGLSRATRWGRDYTEAELRGAIIDFIAGFPVYRTYVTEQTERLTEIELGYVREGLEVAKDRTELLDARALEFLAGILSLKFPADWNEEDRTEAREFVMRFQQLSGPATAKGLEDTAFYRYTRFVSLNEVGGEPGRFGISLEEFHAYQLHKQGKWPHSMLATSTHDTKRGEDTRARLNVLSEMPEEWEKKVREWRELNGGRLEDGAPQPADEYLLYQVLVGTWNGERELEGYVERLQNYMLKATREAKTHTAWTEPNEKYESGTKRFIEAIIKDRKFRASLAEFAGEVAYFGMFNSIAQVLLKCSCPGVPDFYQGSEHWDLTLVDPDNRRPIDYGIRKRLLGEVQNAEIGELLANWESGGIKIFTVANCLRIRREEAALREGEYRPVEVRGAKAEHVVAFERRADNGRILVAVPRFVRTLTGGRRMLPTAEDWGDTRLEIDAGDFVNLITGERSKEVQAATLFARFPAAILRVK
jgi:(1->4)-alpha-D-glucan 1-alpha-D-glucosylmutase